MESFRGKKVVVMGLGLHGGAVRLAAWFFAHGARVVVTDLKTPAELTTSVNRLTELCDVTCANAALDNFYSIEYVLGEHREKDFTTSDLIVQNPGVPRESPYIALARQAGIPVENEATLFFSLTPGVKKIAVTGTRGKSTATALIFHILHATLDNVYCAGIATREGAKSFFSDLDEILTERDKGHSCVAVVELSSWQLELFEKTKPHPAIAVVTNVLPDHLNRYSDFSAYANAKKRIFQFQEKTDRVILNYDNETTRNWGASVPSTLVWFSRQGIPEENGVFLDRTSKEGWIVHRSSQGDRRICVIPPAFLASNHRVENILAAAAAALACGAGSETIAKALQNFKGVPDRLEFLGKYHGRLCYNDTTATTPDATLAALQTFSHKERAIVLIAGGDDKNLSYDIFGKIAAKACRAVVLLPGSATEKIRSALRNANFAGTCVDAPSMREAVECAWSVARNGDILLLSPAAASFNIFANEFDRGRQFVNELENLK